MAVAGSGRAGGGGGGGGQVGRLRVRCGDRGGGHEVLGEGVSGATADSVALLCRVNRQVAEQGLSLHPGQPVGREVGDGDGQVDGEGGEELQVGRGRHLLVHLGSGVQHVEGQRMDKFTGEVSRVINGQEPWLA